MRVAFLVLSYLLVSCSPSTKNKVISGTVSYSNGGYLRSSIRQYEFTRSNVYDSLYTETYTWKTINPSDTSQRYSHNYTFNLVPSNPHAKQEVLYNNSLTSSLWLLDSQTYHIENYPYTVYKYASDARADNFCVHTNPRFWSPEFGMVIWDLPLGLMHVEPIMLVKPLVPTDSVTVAMILDSLYDDPDFLRYLGASDKSTVKICDVNRPSVDQPERITELRKYINRSLNYPEAARVACVSGTAYVDIKVDTAGSIVNKKIFISESEFLTYTDIFEKECWRVLESFPDLKPMTFRGRKIPTQYSFPFTFTLPDPEMCKDTLAKREEERIKIVLDQVYVVTEKRPEFPGGEEALQQYIDNELKYPRQAKKDEVSGTVVLSFIIGKDGEIGEVKVNKILVGDYQDQFRAEALRLVENMPKWRPGEIKEGPVKVRYSLPIKFEL